MCDSAERHTAAGHPLVVKVAEAPIAKGVPVPCWPVVETKSVPIVFCRDMERRTKAGRKRRAHSAAGAVGVGREDKRFR